jgi:hypothetical protein
MLLSTVLPAQDKADVVLLNGKIYTANDRDQFAQGVAIRDSIILKVGSNTLIRTYIDDNTVVYNLNGKLVTPGFIDSHNHMVTAAETKVLSMNLLPPDIQSIDDIQERIKTELERKEPGEWVYGHGFFNLSDGRMPNRYDLDAIAPENPVYIIHISGHMAVANSMALTIAGIDSSTVSPPGGIVEKDSVTNEPTGILFNHYAMILVHKHLPQYSIQEYRAALETLLDEYHKAGITSIHDVNVGMTEKLMAYKEADSLNTLKVRCNVLYTCEVPQHVYHALNYFGAKDSTTYETGMLKLGGFKLLLDGYAPMAYCYEPTDGITWELGTWDPDTLKKVTSMIHEAGYQIAMHCMGDRAIDMALDAYEHALQKTPKPDHRHRLEHCLIPTQEAIQRIKQLGLIVSVQPGALYFSGNSYRKIFGEERLERFMPIKTMLDMAIPLAFGSDYPTEPDLNPLLALQEAIVRKTASGYEIAPNERIGRMQAIRLHTIGSAYAAFEEDSKGSIEDGKLADMVVWSDDYFSVPVSEIKDLILTSVIVNGVVYQNDLTGVTVNDSKAVPGNCELYQTFPNPFNGTVSIDYTIKSNRPVPVNLTIYNLMGQKVATLLDKAQTAGRYHIVWDGKDAAGQTVAGGLYICALTVQKQKQYARMLYQK